MIVTGFNIAPDKFVPGDEMTLSFTVKVEKSDTVNGLRVWMRVPGSGEHVCWTNHDWRLSAGSSRSMQLSFTAPDGPSIQNLLAESRAIAVDLIGIQFGNYGTRTNIACDLHILDAWYRPSVERLFMERCTNGIPDDEGESLLADMKLACAPAAKLKNMQVRLYYSRNAAADTGGEYLDLTGSIDALLAGVQDDAEIVPGVYGKDADWNFMLWFGDEYESTVLSYGVPRAFANVHLSGRSTGGVCFGGFSRAEEGNPLFQCYYPSEFYEGIKGGFSYSYGEEDTGGKWIDGRRIYRKVMTINVTANTDTLGEEISPMLLDVIGVEGTYCRTSDRKWFPLNFWYSNTAYVNCQISADNKPQVRAGWDGIAYVTVMYTKDIF